MRLLRMVGGAIFVGFIALVFFVSSALAATLIQPKDQMTRQQVSQESVHTIRFVTPSGVTDSGDTVNLIFPSGFDLSALTSGSVAVYAGDVGVETARTVSSMGGVSATGVWGLSRSGQAISLSAPSDPLISGVGAGKSIVIVIGGAAGNRIINPSTADLYRIYISGTFEDTADIPVPIVTSDRETITATIPSTGGGGGAGGAGGGGGGMGSVVDGREVIDGTGPVISNVRVINITASTADILWTTDEASDSRVEYGVTPSALTPRTDGTRVTAHLVRLTGLTPETGYLFRVASADATGNVTVDSTLRPFTTLAPPRAPVISRILISSITDRSAVITWETDIETSGEVEYGLTTGYGSVQTEGGAVGRVHRVLLEGLSSDKVYFFRVRARSADGLSAVSDGLTFRTLGDTTPPSNPFGFSATGGRRQVSLVWTNPTDPDFSRVTIVARTDRPATSPSDGRIIYEGSGTSYVDGSLLDGTRYFYTIFARDAIGNRSSGAIAQATTLPSDPAEPVVIPPPEEPVIIPPPTDPVISPVPPVVRPVTPGEPVVPSVPTPPVPPTTPPISPTGEPGVGPSLPVPPIIVATDPGIASPSSTEPSIQATVESALNFSVFAHNGLVELVRDTQGRVTSLPGRALTVRIPFAALGAEPQSGILRVGSASYLLSPNQGRTAFEVSFVPGQSVESVSFSLELAFSGGQRRMATQPIQLVAGGSVYEQTLLARNRVGIEGAEVRVFIQQGGAWVLLDGARVGGANPLVTGSQGAYAAILPNGSYQLRVTKEGYRETIQDISIRNNILNASIGLKKELSSLADAIDPNASLGENLQAVGEQAAILAEDVRGIMQDERVQAATQNVVAPTVVAVTAASTATAVTGFNLLNYLRFLVTQPLLLIGRRKRKKWGTVYNALSKQPIELAIVRLLNAKTRLVMQTRITDAQGRFSFTVPPGEYLIQAIKPGFGFPTKYLGEQREDGDFLDVYHGETIQVKEASAISPSIPLDPASKEETPKQVLRKALWRKVQKKVSALGMLISFVALLIQPSILMAGFIVFQVVSYLLFKRLALPPKSKEWGIVYNEATKKPLEKTVVRIFDKKFNKLLETQVTDREGKYGFFAGKGLYYVTAEKVGFEKMVTPDLDFTKAQEAFVDQKLGLKPVKG